MHRLVAMLASIVLFAESAFAQPADAGKPFVNSIGMKLVWIPAGSFTMGSSNKEKGRGDDEVQRQVAFTAGFYMGAHAVTQEQWRKVMGGNPSHFKGEANLPVDSVSWHDCKAFCKTLGMRERKSYRLPTEAEWEYACRAGTTTAYHTGDTLSTDQANYNGNFVYGAGTKGVFREKTTPVGSFPANAWGLFDMHGNVWQWCEDWHGGYARADVVDPTGPKTGKSRILRGASWSNHPIFARSANRNFADPDTRIEHNGFRVVLAGK